MRHSRFLIISAACLALIAACSKTEPELSSAVTIDSNQDPAIFSIVAIPDTQNYLDYTHQKTEGFALDAADQFLQQMHYIATLAPSRGGDLAFVTHLGDVWQHQTVAMDAEHAELGFKTVANPWFASEIKVAPEQVKTFEIPRAIAGFKILADADIPFAVVPGNHDYDAMWSAEGWTPVTKIQDIRMTAETLGMLHAGGLESFRSVFGENSQFFHNKPWYVSSFDGGTSSAQTFSAGGYTFLHLALDMSPKDDVLAWAGSVIQKNYGLPTIVTTHDYLNGAGERKANPIVDFHRADARHNNAQMLWDKFIKENDQIFMVLSGHQYGQSLATDINTDGHFVYQILSDYQDRGQSGVEAGQALHPLLRRPVGIGDGWLRRMTFDFSQAMPLMVVKTYSSHYQINSQDLKDYAGWYGAHEQPDMSEAQFIAADNFEVELEDFRQRFGDGLK